MTYEKKLRMAIPKHHYHFFLENPIGVLYIIDEQGKYRGFMSLD